MNLKNRILWALMLLPIPALLAAAGGVGGNIEITEYYVRAVPPVSPNTALFMMVRNPGDTERILTGVSTPAAKSAEIHLSRKEGAGMKMEHVREITIGKKEMIPFSPEGYHVMLIGLKKPLKEGENVPVTLSFKNGEPLTIYAPVKKMMEQAEHHH